MKTILLIILLSAISYSQTALDSCKTNFLIARATTKKVRDSLAIEIKANAILKSKDSILATDLDTAKSDIIHYKLQIRDRDSQLQLYHDKYEGIQLEPLIKFTGFFAGISAQYNFNDSILTKTTFINGLQYSLEVTGGVIWASKWALNGTLGIPLSRNKLYIKAYIGYRLW